MIRKFILFGLTALLLAACGKDEAEQAAGTSVSRSSGDLERNILFERIDADTIYLAANLETLPDSLVDKFLQPLAAMGEMNAQTYGKLAEEIASESPLMAALARELAQIDGREAIEARGINSNGFWALHAISIYPMFHIELIDPAAFDAMLERVAAESGTPLPTRVIDDQEIIWSGLESFGLAIHHNNGIATVAVVPDNDLLLRRVANLDQPAQAYDPSDLADFNQGRDYTPNGSGFLEFAGLLERLMDADDELIAPGRTAMDLNALIGDEICRAELNRLFEIFPRISAGVTEVSNRRVDANMVFETEAALAEKMVPIGETPVGLRSGETTVLSGGIAFDMVSARDFAREVVAGWVDSPPQCDLFATIAEKAGDWQRALNQPIPPVVTNIQGFRFNLSQLDLQGSMNVEGAAGTLALFVRNPQMLLGMAQMFSPELAALELKPNGEPKPLPAGLIPNLPDLPAFIALGNAAIGLAVGENEKDGLPSALAAQDPDSAIMGYTIDITGYGQLLEKMMAMIAEENDGLIDEDELPPPDFMVRLGEYYDKSSIFINLTSQGIVISSSTTLKP